MGDRREEDEARRGGSVIFLRKRVLDELVEIALEFGESFGTGERFVVTEKGENHIGFVLGQMLVGRAEAGRAESKGQFVAGKAQVANHQFMFGKSSLNSRFEPTVMLHPLGERVADQAEMIAFFQDERVFARAVAARVATATKQDKIAMVCRLMKSILGFVCNDLFGNNRSSGYFSTREAFVDSVDDKIDVRGRIRRNVGRATRGGSRNIPS